MNEYENEWSWSFPDGDLGCFAEYSSQSASQGCANVEHQAEQRRHQKQGKYRRHNQAAQHYRAQTSIEFRTCTPKQHQGQHAEDVATDGHENWSDAISSCLATRA